MCVCVFFIKNIYRILVHDLHDVYNITNDSIYMRNSKNKYIKIAIFGPERK